jgi:ornithine cyclodeaminase/alanine dehydrogenase
MVVPVLEEVAGWLEEGAFASLVDFDSYFTGSALKQADKFATDDIEQMTYYRSLGYFADPPRMILTSFSLAATYFSSPMG